MTILDDINAEIATLVREQTTPAAPFGYGRDPRCVTDLHDDLAETDPDSPEGIGEAIARRWTCERGQNVDDLDYGRNLRGMLNRGVTRAELMGEEGLLKAEAEKEETVDKCDVSLEITDGGKTIKARARILPKDPTIEPFTLTLAVTSGEVMLEIQR